MAKTKQGVKNKQKHSEQRMDGLGVSFEDAMKFFANPQPYIEKPITERLNLVRASIIEIAINHNINPPESIFLQFDIIQEDNKVQHVIARDANHTIVNECYAVYRYYFPA